MGPAGSRRPAASASLGRNGDVFGVVGKKPIHLMKSEDREKASKMRRPLGRHRRARQREKRKPLISVGDPGVIDARSIELPNGRLVSRSIDDRIGAFIVLEALRRYAEKPGKARVVAVATTQEEIAYHGGGARVCASCINPQMAIVVDVTFATDHPSIEKKEHRRAQDRRRPGAQRAAPSSRPSSSSCCATPRRRAASRSRFTRQAAIRAPTPMRSTSRAKASPPGSSSIPNRYMHSPNEMVSLEDVDNVAELIAETCRAVTDETDFTAR